MGGRRSAPRVINTPTGPRRPREDRDREDRFTRPRPSEGFKPRKFQAPDMRDDPTRPRTPSLSDRERRQETSGDSFRESRRERRRRRMAGDRKEFFGRVEKPNRPIMPKDRRSGLGGADGMPEEIRKRREAIEGIGRNFGTTINMSADATPEQRKQAFDKLVEERGSIRGFPRGRNRNQNTARTDV